MNKVIAINLNNNAYPVDEAGYIALKQYLEAAELQLTDNPDRAEIVADLEQAIADKCQKRLGPHKNVVTVAEVAQIIAEMGPVDGAAGETGEDQGERQDSAKGRSEDKANPPRRLYLIREGSMLSGVCEGIGAFVHVDPTIVRIAFAILTIASGGVFILAYAFLALVIPSANTPEERAAAQGKRFSAQDVIDEAKKTYEDFRNNKEWKKNWTRQKLEWQRKWRHETGLWSQNLHRNSGYASQIVGGLMFPILFILNIALSLVALLAIFAFVTNGTFFGWRFPPRTPGFMELVVILVIVGVVTAPIRAGRRASYYAAGFSQAEGSAVSLLWLGFLAVAVWFAYLAIPEFHYIINNLPDILNGVFG